MGVFFFFDDYRMNCSMYLSILSAVLYLGPDYFVPSWSATHGVPVIDAPCGKIAGSKLESRDGRLIFAYTGIPYAKPPIGELRFSKPQPLSQAFEDVFMATRPPKPCITPFTMGPIQSHRGSEDCLKLSVYIPHTITARKKLPVMFWIHGGGFVSGDITDFVYGSQFLLDRDVILVKVAYRLGPLGYLNLGHEMIPGNQGMWDQRLGMRWVQENIAAFGGDPTKVTIFGESAGSMAVMYHLTSPSSVGLFSAAIAQSGSIPFSSFLNFDKKRQPF
eukprot:maker-scaffold2255_size18018-snap-gene-0.9 protein:Tk05960 transcript:maker-scaffold2255_size18018-snap-gene-0.9-mRNA-1 annotation:"esterase fe4"